MTILFLDDWHDAEGRPRAMVHKTTRNKSFLRVGAYFHQLGIRNRLFHLALHDPDLANYDPHKLTDPSIELRLRIAHECNTNIWYFLREVLRIPMQGGAGISFEAHRGNISMAWCYLAGIDYISIQPRQTGKAQPLDSLIKTPTGWTHMGDIRVGDTVSIPDGSTAKVKGVYPQGLKNIYRITFEDGRSTECCEEHLWTVYNRYWSPESTRWRTVQLKDIRDRIQLRPNTEAGLFIPLSKPELDNDIDLPIDPYVIGALLGDGGLSTGVANFTNPEQFIIDELERRLPKHVELIHSDRITYRLIDRTAQPGGRSPFLSTLRELGMLGSYSYNKTIPECYLNASSRQKLLLLQGLMDTDGSVDKTSSCTYCTTSKTLASQVQSLVWSLGGICKLKLRYTFYTYKGERKKGRLSYTLRIRMDNPKSLFRLPRKRDCVTDNYKSAGKLKLGIQSVQYMGKKLAQCIEVDHPDHLYITDDFIVTHNTIAAIGITTWVIYIKGRQLQFAMFTKDNKLLQENVARLKAMRDGLPNYLIQHQVADTDNKEGIVYAALNNKYSTFVAQKDKQAAANVARGETIPTVHVDEFGFIVNIEISHSVIMAATTTASKNAKKMDMPHANLYTTTAARTDTSSGKFAFNYVNEAMPFTERLYDTKNADDAKKMVMSNSTNGKVNGTWSYLQLGKTHEWFVETIAKVGATEDEVDRDFLNIWKAGTETSILSTEMIAKMKAHQIQPTFIEVMHDDYVFNWYVPEPITKTDGFKNRTFVLAMDSSDVIGRDFTALVLLDPMTLKVIATFRCNESNIIKLGLFIGDFLVRYPKTVFIPERKSSAASIIDQIILILVKYGFNPLLRIFNKIVQERDKQPFSDIRINDPGIVDSVNRKYIGFMTDGKTRPFLYKNVLNKATRLNADRIYDATIINELSALSVVNGRVDHSSGSHDDTALAYLLANWLLFEGKNLHMYGLDVETIMNEIAVNTEGQKVDPRYRQMQLELRKKIRHYEALIDATYSQTIKTMFRQKIYTLEQQLDDSITVEPVIGEQVKNTLRDFGDVYNQKRDDAPMTPRKVDSTYLSSITDAMF